MSCIIINNYMKKQTWQERFKEEFMEYAYENENTLLDNDIEGDRMIKFISEVEAQTREETLKELVREYQDNELDGKDYDFYFSIRAKIDILNKLK